MTAPPRRRIGALALALVALCAGTAPALADQVEDKRREAAAIASKLEDQARSLVALDREHRKAREEQTVADAAVARAEAELASATRRQDDARRLLVVHAQAAYASGGTVTFLGRMARATVDDAAARRTYLRIASGEDRQAIGRLQAAREDLDARRKSLADARKTAAGRTDLLAADLDRFDKAIAAQRALLATANGDLGRLVAAEQARRDAEAARAASARQAQAGAAAPPTTAAPAPRAGAVTTAPPAPTTTAPKKPAPESSASIDETSPASASWSRATTTSPREAAPTSSWTRRGTPSATRGAPRTTHRPSRTRRPAGCWRETVGTSGPRPPSAAGSEPSLVRVERPRHHVAHPLADVDGVVGDALEVPAQ